MVSPHLLHPNQIFKNFNPKSCQNLSNLTWSPKESLCTNDIWHDPSFENHKHFVFAYLISCFYSSFYLHFSNFGQIIFSKLSKNMSPFYLELSCNRMIGLVLNHWLRPNFQNSISHAKVPGKIFHLYCIILSLYCYQFIAQFDHHSIQTTPPFQFSHLRNSRISRVDLQQGVPHLSRSNSSYLARYFD